MSPVFTARRRAEEFAAQVEDPSAGGIDSARYAELLELVGAMQAAPPPAARPEFVADLRVRLMAEAASARVPDDTARLTLPPRRRARDRRIAAVVGGIAIVGASTSVAMAAEQALPGDALYPVKRAIEDVHTRVSIGDADKGRTVLANADDRLDEVGALARSGDAADQARVAGTLDDFASQATQASHLLLADYASSGHEDSITQVRAFAASSLDRLTALEPLVPGEARDELVRAAKVVVAIDAAARQACPACGEGITSIPPLFAASSTTGGAANDGSTAAVGDPSDGSSGGQGTTRAEQGPSTGSPVLPGLGQESLPPGSVLGSGGDGQGVDQQGADAGTGTLGTIIDGVTGSLNDGLTGGLTDQSPSPDQTSSQSPSVPDLGGTLDDTLDGLDDTVGGVTGGLTGDQP